MKMGFPVLSAITTWQKGRLWQIKTILISTRCWQKQKNKNQIAHCCFWAELQHQWNNYFVCVCVWAFFGLLFILVNICVFSYASSSSLQDQPRNPGAVRCQHYLLSHPLSLANAKNYATGNCRMQQFPLFCAVEQVLRWEHTCKLTDSLNNIIFQVTSKQEMDFRCHKILQ